MNTYHFTIFVRDAIFSETLEDTLYGAGLDDALVCSVDGLVYLEFDREAMSAKAAIDSAFADLQAAGFHDLILQEAGVATLSEMAKRAGLSRMAMTNYAKGVRGSGDFPKPVYGVRSGSALYAWRDVAAWLYAQDKLPKADVEVAAYA